MTDLAHKPTGASGESSSNLRQVSDAARKEAAKWGGDFGGKGIVLGFFPLRPDSIPRFPSLEAILPLLGAACGGIGSGLYRATKEKEGGKTTDASSPK